MALLQDYEIPGTGVVIQNAYHVITKVDVEKRVHDVEPPPDSSREDGKTAGGKEPGKEIYWKAGYVGRICVTVWKDAESRENGARPLGYVGVSPTDNTYNASIGTEGKDHICLFFIDNDSPENHITQAYRHLKSTDYYNNAQEI